MFWIIGYSLNEGHQLLQVIHCSWYNIFSNISAVLFVGRKDNMLIICALEN